MLQSSRNAAPVLFSHQILICALVLKIADAFLVCNERCSFATSNVVFLVSPCYCCMLNVPFEQASASLCSLDCSSSADTFTPMICCWYNAYESLTSTHRKSKMKERSSRAYRNFYQRSPCLEIMFTSTVYHDYYISYILPRLAVESMGIEQILSPKFFSLE